MMGEILGLRRGFSDRLTLALIGAIAPYAGLIAMQNVWDRSAIMHIGRRRRHRVDSCYFAIDTDVRLHSEIPLIAFFGLMHLRVALAIRVLGRGWCGDYSRVHNGTCANLDPLGREMLVDGGKQLLTKALGFNQMTEFANCRCAGRPARSRWCKSTTMKE